MAVIVPRVEGDWLTVSTDLWLDVDKVNILIEPVLLEEGHHSPLYDDVMRTGVAVYIVVCVNLRGGVIIY